jgi:hypothetical protein
MPSSIPRISQFFVTMGGHQLPMVTRDPRLFRSDSSSGVTDTHHNRDHVSPQRQRS